MNKKINVSFPGGKRVTAQIDNTVIETDQSVKNGGEASAPEPFQLFLASIATCAGIYALEFCLARNLPTDDLSLSMNCERDPEGNRYIRMTIALKLPDAFPEKFIPAIIKAMGLCAVKKHINIAPEFIFQVSR